MIKVIVPICFAICLSPVINTLSAQQLAFPTAEGAGKYALGGRGGAVYEVTNLDDSGPGSLRYAISMSGPRTIVFRVSGTIILESRLSISNPYCTIAGQTAPGDGICIRDFNFTVKANDVVIRYIRFRLGDVDSTYDDDTFDGQNCMNVIIDHCSISWSIDEAMSIYSGMEDFTVQWCFITESLRYSHHEKGAHGYGGIWGGKNVSWHHNLLAHHSSRTPRWDRGLENVDERNCVIYNWTFNSCYGGEANATRTSTINMVGNYYKAGPSTQSGAMRYRIANPSNEGYGYGQWHIAENYVYGYPLATADNWTYGVQGIHDTIKAAIRAATPFPYTPINQHTPEEAYDLVLQHGGASLPERDTIDKRIVYEVQNGIALYGGITGANSGIIDSQNDVGGWSVLNSSPAPQDTDHDGMPDTWELAHGLNPSDPADRNIVAPSGYTMLEEYLNNPESVMSTITAISSSWNLVSVPLLQSDYSADVIFSDKLGDMYSYNTMTLGYDAAPVLSNGPGYWVNYQNPDTVVLSGFATGQLTITAAQAGWILIGSRAISLQVSSLVLSDDAVVNGSAYIYDPPSQSYHATTVINPGDACWINVNKACTITIP